MSSATSFVLVIRGPAGSGKSTVSKLTAARLRAAGLNVALLEMDYFRNTIPGGGKGSRELCLGMLEAAAMEALKHHYCIVLEGILNKAHYTGMLERIAAAAGACTFAYFDVSLEEVQRRHTGRSKAAEFGVDMISTWYPLASPLGVPGEVIVSEASTQEESVALLLRSVGRGDLAGVVDGSSASAQAGAAAVPAAAVGGSAAASGTTDATGAAGVAAASTTTATA